MVRLFGEIMLIGTMAALFLYAVLGSAGWL